MIDYALWEVIENGNTLPRTQLMEGVVIVMPIITVKEKAQRRLEVKARSTLMMGISNEHQLKFNSIKDAKSFLEAIEKRFEMLDQTFDRLQKLVSLLELLGEKLLQEDVNKKFLRSLSPEWNTYVVVWRNKADLDTMRKKLNVNSNETIGFDKSKVECYNCHKFARECGASRNQDNKNKEVSRRSIHMETTTSTTLVSCYGLGGYDWSDRADKGPNYALMAFSSLSSNSEIVNNCKKGLGYESYNAVPPLYTGKFMPPTPNLSLTGLDEFANNPIVESCKAKSSEEESVIKKCKAKPSEEEPKVVRKCDDALIIQ
nr:hypothetical protein [Tanacetum cinerariifolium]